MEKGKALTPEAARQQQEARLREHIKDTLIRPKELKAKARAAKDTAWREANRIANESYDHTGFRPNHKGMLALEKLGKDMQERVCAHGVASNLPTTDPDFPIAALVDILATGELKGDSTRLSGGVNQVVFTNAPFVLLSNVDEPLTEYDEKTQRQILRGLRSVLVNGEYEGIVDDLRKAFPWVSFRTADQITDDMFNKKAPAYRSYEERIKETIDKHSLTIDLGP